MNKIKNAFSIRDLENLTGIKMHTIRIWEKRYNLFQPERTENNIRFYSLSSLQKILNVRYLYNNGLKISKIAALDEEEIKFKALDLADSKKENSHAVDAIKVAMFDFDQALFYNTLDDLLAELSFRDVFYKVIIPLFEEIGMLWQTNTISIAHEHFICELVKHKIIYNTEKIIKERKEFKSKRAYVLFLPENELHEIGLLYLNYELLSKGYSTIYLGQSIPNNSIKDLADKLQEVTFISCFTIMPIKDEVNAYIQDFKNKNLLNENNKLIVWGPASQYIDLSNFSDLSIQAYQSVKDIIDII